IWAMPTSGMIATLARAPSPVTMMAPTNIKPRWNRGFLWDLSALVAPVTLHQGAYLGAGSVITQNIPSDTLAITRAPLTTVPHWSQRRHKEKPPS
ncbi:MAG: hypothetical protein ACKO57_06520, partial [Alphaproteobacteria bacterium]